MKQVFFSQFHIYGFYSKEVLTEEFQCLFYIFVAFNSI